MGTESKLESKLRTERIQGKYGLVQIYGVKLNGGEIITDGIVQKLRNPTFRVDRNITQNNFPFKLGSKAIKYITVEIINPRHSFDNKEGSDLLKAVDLEYLTYQYAFRFIEQFGIRMTGGKPFIIFPKDKPWLDPNGRRRVLCLSCDPEDRGLILAYSDGRFGPSCVIAGWRPFDPQDFC